MQEIELKGVVVKFPFQPYKVQEDYMSKVIECLQDRKHGVLESPTGTGKTLCLLCSSLSWLLVKKAQLQMQVQTADCLDQVASGNDYVSQFSKSLNKAGGKALVENPNAAWENPKIIYASRTHSQLSQAMQELKRTAYSHVRVTVLGSRDQLCINPEVAAEPNTMNKIHMCQAKVKNRTCHYYNNVDLRKDDASITDNILDIEDLVKTGTKLRCCPYYLSRELKQSADIIFMPYNYILDPKTRKTQGIDLNNNVILLDEAHNVEKMCEEAASLQISSTDIAVCIDEITYVMEAMAKEEENPPDFNSEEADKMVAKDFTCDDLVVLKAMFLELEKAIDAIQIKNREEGDTYPGGYMFELLAKADLTQGKDQLVIDKLDKIILYLTTVSGTSFQRRGNALQKFSDTLRVVFAGSANANYRDRIRKCYKVYIQKDQPKKASNNSWESKNKINKTEGKLICYWCFSPGFGMQNMLDQGVRSVILTSGTLSPLKPFISEIGINISVQLENPHIVSEKQICVGVVATGHDGYTLNSSYNTRNDPNYIASLGETIKILSCILPHGLLIFFPSYPIMKKCQEEWQRMGKWSQIENAKAIFVEPQSKHGFNSLMNDYYKKINDPTLRGAIFMAVCRGKVSEGLDFANANGRAVLITGLPFPPLKDPRVILKQRYLEENRVPGVESLTGQQWYQLEASRAVNQAIGRIIRHKNDYGAILLCDCRFDNPSFKQHLSSWIRPYIKKFPHFRGVVKELREFFKYAKEHLPQPANTHFDVSGMALPAVQAEFDTTAKKRSNSNFVAGNCATTNDDDTFDLSTYKTEQMFEEKSKDKKDFASLFEVKQKTAMNFATSKLQQDKESSIDKMLGNIKEPAAKKRKLKITPIDFVFDEPLPIVCTPVPSTSSESPKPEEKKSSREQGMKYLKAAKGTLSKENYAIFKKMVANYKEKSSFEELIMTLEELFMSKLKVRKLFVGFRTFVKKEHLKSFDEYVEMMEGNF
ncbi:regulator of telomere elongation helicase 1 homolog [Trichogramma pretiosum]|uniref:regulator of telomere elongation helicase 1 homolog n=1 Tax=Trichogramma pretiosum TaxID=7493 RepID=UPI0006C97F61|nr:regulator of telomere elongation helicase 1 homolog [Trichogramma pretiosum]